MTAKSENTQYHNKKLDIPNYWDMLSIEQVTDTVIVELSSILPVGVDVFEYGAGRGRNAIPLAEKGYQVTASDIATKAIQDLQNTARKKNLTLQTVVSDARDIEHKKMYDAFVAIRILHFLPTEDAIKIIQTIQIYTKIGGYNTYIVFSRDNEKNGGFYFPSRDELVAEYDGWKIISESKTVTKTVDGKEMPRFSILLQRLI